MIGPGVAWYLAVAGFLFGTGSLGVLLRRTWVQMTRYGRRVRVVELTLERVADALVDNLKQLLGVIPVFQVRLHLPPMSRPQINKITVLNCS